MLQYFQKNSQKHENFIQVYNKYNKLFQNFK